MNEKLSAKYHSTQIESIVILSNGDIAVSGGPLNYEILIYRNKVNTKWSELGQGSTNYELVDSISTKGEQV